MTSPVTIASMTVAMVIAIVLGVMVAEVIDRSMIQYEDSCDEQYGEDNWTTVPANESERQAFFIGQQWVCVPEDSPRAG